MILDLYNRTDMDFFVQATENKVIGLTSGCYDLLHYMHLFYFQRCRRLCDVLIVGVDSDDLVRRAKGPGRPIVAEDRRIFMVDALKPIHATFIMGTVDDFRRAVAELRVDKIFKNQDFDKVDIKGSDLAEVVIVPDVDLIDSTSAMIKCVVQKQGEQKKD